MFFWILLGGAAWLTGRYARSRRLAVQRSEDRAELLEQRREELTREAIAGERSRIARELHDVIAHSVSLMGLQRPPPSDCWEPIRHVHGKPCVRFS